MLCDVIREWLIGFPRTWSSCRPTSNQSCRAKQFERYQGPAFAFLSGFSVRACLVRGSQLCWDYLTRSRPILLLQHYCPHLTTIALHSSHRCSSNILTERQ